MTDLFADIIIPAVRHQNGLPPADEPEAYVSIDQWIAYQRKCKQFGMKPMLSLVVVPKSEAEPISGWFGVPSQRDKEAGKHGQIYLCIMPDGSTHS